MSFISCLTANFGLVNVVSYSYLLAQSYAACKDGIDVALSRWAGGGDKDIQK